MSTWELHSKIFQPYFGWCNHVGLPFRPQSHEQIFAKSNPYTDQVVHMLLNELALYMCIWTESANLRYMPEMLCFIYYTMRFSPAFDSALKQEEKWRKIPSDPTSVSKNKRSDTLPPDNSWPDPQITVYERETNWITVSCSPPLIYGTFARTCETLIGNL